MLSQEGGDLGWLFPLSLEDSDNSACNLRLDKQPSRQGLHPGFSKPSDRIPIPAFMILVAPSVQYMGRDDREGRYANTS